KDPAAQLSTLYEKTQDAMVAFELARVFETASQNAEAAKWYNLAAERFRRADWKTKAQQAATRLGGESSGDSQLDFPQLRPQLPVPEAGAPFEDSAVIFDAIATPASAAAPAEDSEDDSESESEAQSKEASASSASSEKQSAEGSRRRRGRRGGRNRRKGGRG